MAVLCLAYLWAKAAKYAERIWSLGGVNSHRGHQLNRKQLKALQAFPRSWRLPHARSGQNGSSSQTAGAWQVASGGGWMRSRLCQKKINAGLMGATSGFHQLSMSCRVKQPPVNMGTTENMKIEGFGGGFFALKTSRVCPPIVPPQRAKALWWKDHPPGLWKRGTMIGLSGCIKLHPYMVSTIWLFNIAVENHHF